MKNYLLAVAFLLIGISPVSSQVKGNIIKYIKENKLYAKGNDVTVTNIDLEWPVELDGDGMPNLQKELCKQLLDVNASDLLSGWTELHAGLGKAIASMPDSAERHYLNISLKLLWNERERYVSVYSKRQVTNQEGHQVSATKKMLTYDMLSGEIVTADRVMSSYVEDYARALFEALIDENAVCSDNDKANIDLTTLPNDFAIMGGAMVINLGGAYDNDNYAPLTLNSLYSLGMLKHSFVRWIGGKGKKKTVNSIAPVDFDSTLSGDTIVNSGATLSSFPGGNDSLVAFIRNNVEYPDVDKMLHHQGTNVMSFIVEKDGSISDITVISPLAPGLDRESVRVLRLMSKWIPAERNGEKVRTRMTLPVAYRLKAK